MNIANYINVLYIYTHFVYIQNLQRSPTPPKLLVLFLHTHKVSNHTTSLFAFLLWFKGLKRAIFLLIFVCTFIIELWYYWRQWLSWWLNYFNFSFTVFHLFVQDLVTLTHNWITTMSNIYACIIKQVHVYA